MPVKKTKIMLTEEEEKLTKKFRSDVSKIDKLRQIVLRHVSGRGVSMRKKKEQENIMSNSTY